MKPAVSSSSSMMLLACLLVYRSILIHYSPIMDCDEVYNYWEPLHFMLFGSGMQTWEYSPEYSLRTFAYLTPIYLVGRATLWIRSTMDKVMLFKILRSSLAGVTGWAEFEVFNSLLESPGIDDVIAYVYLSFSLMSPGMFHASGALLPSSTAMQMVMFSVAQLIRSFDGGAQQIYCIRNAIFIGLCATLAIGWPFCALCWIPCGLYAIWVHYSISDGTSYVSNIVRLLSRTLAHAIVIQILVTGIDFVHYQKLTIPSLNIFLYNTGSSGGDELYGVEAWTYYFKNLLLNFNVIALLSIASIPLLIWDFGWAKTFSFTANKTRLLQMHVLPSLFCWMLVIGVRPHKEERFVFPVYSLFCVSAAETLTSMFRRLNILLKANVGYGNDILGKSLFLCVLMLCSLISMSRMLALHHYYSAPIEIYSSLFERMKLVQASSSRSNMHVCVGGEWYRFPSSFFLPDSLQLSYLPSSFKGQLPQPFPPGGVSVDPTGPFNNKNREEESRYISGGVNSCAFLIALVFDYDRKSSDSVYSILDEMKADATGTWKNIENRPFLNAEGTSVLVRSLYLPFASQTPAMGQYQLFAKTIF